MSLGFYTINPTLIESDLIPELIGEGFGITERFFFATSYEDEENIYMYCDGILSEDEIDDIMESLLMMLDLIKDSNPDESINDVWEDFSMEKNDNFKKKEALVKLFTLAQKNGYDIALELTVPTRKESEFIIVLHDNLEYKLDYYNNNYNDNLELIRNTDIKILNANLIKWDIDYLKIV